MNENKKKLIYNVAKDIRKKSEAYAKKHRLNNDLCGLCASASMALFHVLKYNLEIYDVVLMKAPTHCWVECEGIIIDITATQFGLQEKILFKKKGNVFFHYDYSHGKSIEKNDDEWNKWNGHGPQDVNLFENILKIDGAENH